MGADDGAMQSRCPNCLAEQYCLNILAFSDGEIPCGTCGKKTEPMSLRQWYDAISAARARQQQ